MATRAGFARRLRGMGIPCNAAEVMNAAYAAAWRLKRERSRGGRFLVLGHGGMGHELRRSGLRLIRANTREGYLRCRDRRDIRAVVVGSIQGVTYWELCAAHVQICRGVPFFASNCDSTYPVSGGTLPGTGAIVNLLEFSSGRRAQVVGKPSPLMFRLILKERGIKPSRVVVVGDRLETDLAAGRALGAPTALVLTGIATRRDLARVKFKPDAVIGDLSELLNSRLLARLARRGASRRTGRG